MQLFTATANFPTRRIFNAFLAGALLLLAALPGVGNAMGLMVDLAKPNCGAALPTVNTPPVGAATRLAGSQVAKGARDIAWAWLGSPTARYPHTALGSRFHAASLHVLLAAPASSTQPLKELVYRLPFNRVFEDLLVRLVDLDQDGRDEIVLVEADALRGASVVVLSVSGTGDAATLIETARSPPAGSTFRWLNPVGFADFDADGKTDIAAVITPHIGGELTLYHYRPPLLVPFAKAMDTSNHLMGAPEQQLAAIVRTPGMRPTVIVPSMTLKALHALRWEGNRDANTQTGAFKELADVMPLPARVERITPIEGEPQSACVLLADGSWRRASVQN